MKRKCNAQAPMQFDALEPRAMFSACPSSAAEPAATPQAALGLTTLATFTRIKGDYSGSIQSNTFGGLSFTLTLTIVKFTHTGHFTGNAVFHFPGNDVSTDFSGRITSTRHVIITFTTPSVTGGLDGKASHTGGSIKGTYQISGAFQDSGTFKAAKP